jgi:peptidoglycan/xylan/chitin deacetylase (PgdA/CDA1 family)
VPSSSPDESSQAVAGVSDLGRASSLGPESRNDQDGVRFLSITFDDGLLHGSEVACEILAKHGLSATFYVVTGWVEPICAAPREPYNAGRSHGDWHHWRRVREAGHEVGSHSFSHVNAGGKKALLMPWLIGQEVARSRADLMREVPQARYTISMPWNAATARSERHVRRHFSACRLGTSAPAYNRLQGLDPFRLASWAPAAATPIAAYERAFADIPTGSWLVLQFHSFDGEGWDPVPRDAFERICRIAAAEPFLEVATVGTVIGRLADGSNDDAAAGPRFIAGRASGA